MERLTKAQIEEILDRGGAVNNPGDRQPWYRNEPGGPLQVKDGAAAARIEDLVGYCVVEVPRPKHAPPFRASPHLSEDEINEVLNRGGAVNYEGDDSPWYRKEPNGGIFFRAAAGELREEGIHALTGLHIMEVPRPEDAPLFRASPAPEATRSATDRQVGGSHYQMPIQPAEYLYANREQIDYISGRAITYLSRWRRKNGVEDLDKAIHCIELVKELHAKEDK